MQAICKPQPSQGLPDQARRRVSGCQSGRRSGGSPEGWGVSGSVFFPCASSQDIGGTSHPPGEACLASAILLSPAVPARAVGVHPCHPGDWVEHWEIRNSRYKAKCFSPAHDGLLLTPRVSEVGTVLMPSAVTQKKMKLCIGAKQSSTSGNKPLPSSR